MAYNFNKYISSRGSEYAQWQHMLRSKMIIYEDRNNWHDGYNRMQFANYHYALTGSREYVFFTKPDLNIMVSDIALNPVIAKDAFWVEMKKYYRDIIGDLQQHAPRSGVSKDLNPFIPMLTNAKSGTLDLPSKSATTTETAATIYGTSLQYRKTSMAADEDYDFSLEFFDNQCLDVYHFFKMWDTYEELKDLGQISPPGNPLTTAGYIRNKILHDQIAIYKFIVDENDMETIIHYSKLTGCFPKSVPREAFGEVKDGLITYSTEWHAQFIEDSNPIILYEFNNLCSKFLGGSPTSMSNFIPVYSPSKQEINGGFVRCPFIAYVNDPTRTTGMRYKLMWLDKLGENRAEKRI